MTTNLFNPSGTDFDNLFERGAGNQLLYIYGVDGQDIGQRYLNISYGSQCGVNTGFVAPDGTELRYKLCGKGKTIVNYSIWFADSGRDVYVSFSNVPPNLSVKITGSFSYTSSEYEGGEDGRGWYDIPHSGSVNTSCGNNSMRIIVTNENSYSVDYNLTFTCNGKSFSTGWVGYHQNTVSGSWG